ncbi:hypothetical protein A7A76_01505 [Lysobacter enzymogenes]|uniref:hypothetical protein n=1 Tax=Lysobacter enzymogenes TaxID=69 RepID=UPI0019CFB8D0|nr:hypothetical protein [Lysobacter enzymogenes]MBN7135352.1 hypothetical protein [Lysobacter enzymogenes]
MNQRKRGARIALAALLFCAAMGFGAFQVVAGNGAAPEQSNYCDHVSCRAECPDFGGDLGPGGPGRPDVCYCCG